MPTIWFSYSFQPYESLDGPEPYKAPSSRTWHMGRFLREQAALMGWDFRYVNLDSTEPVTIGKDDIVLGHLWFNEGSFMQQALRQECRGKFCIQPYTHRMVSDNTLPVLNEMIDLADHLFLVCGPYWYDTMEESRFAHWKAKATRLDNSVNCNHHRYQKKTWNKPGNRGFMCIGYENPIKGMDLIGELARVSGFRLGAFAHPHLFPNVPQLIIHEWVHFTPETVAPLCRDYDFFISMGRFDANPTTLNETSCWGLIGACTTGSGYWPNEPFWELRQDDMVFNLEQIDRWQHLPEYELRERSLAMRRLQETNYTWDRLNNVVWGKIQEWL